MSDAGTVRVYNTSDQPIGFAFGGKSYVWQPRGGGTFGYPTRKVLHHGSKSGEHKQGHSLPPQKQTINELVDLSKEDDAKTKAMLEKNPGPWPDFLDVPEQFARDLQNGMLLGLHAGALKPQKDIAKELDANEKARLDQLRAADVALKAKKAEIEKLDKAIAEKKKQAGAT